MTIPSGFQSGKFSNKFPGTTVSRSLKPGFFRYRLIGHPLYLFPGRNGFLDLSVRRKSIAVVVWIAVIEKKQALDKEIEKRNQTRQYEPSVRSGIMQTSDDKTDGGHERNQGKDVFEKVADG